MPRTTLAQLTMHVGDRAAAVAHARAALPVMRRLGASDDESQLRSMLALCAIADGRLADAEEEISRIDNISEAGLFGGSAMRLICRAELALASGDHAAGLRIHREAAARMRAIQFPGIVLTGLEPWVLLGDSAALSAHACYATGDDEAHGRALFLACRESAVRLFATPGPQLDYPAAGQLLFALSAWALLRPPVSAKPVSGEPVSGEPVSAERVSDRRVSGEIGPAEVAVRLLALAGRFGYNRTMPAVMWQQISVAAEEAAAGRFTEFQAQYRDRRQACLLTEARPAGGAAAGLSPGAKRGYRCRR